MSHSPLVEGTDFFRSYPPARDIVRWRSSRKAMGQVDNLAKDVTAEPVRADARTVAARRASRPREVTLAVLRQALRADCWSPCGCERSLPAGAPHCAAGALGAERESIFLFQVAGPPLAGLAHCSRYAHVGHSGHAVRRGEVKAGNSDPNTAALQQWSPSDRPGTGTASPPVPYRVGQHDPRNPTGIVLSFHSLRCRRRRLLPGHGEKATRLKLQIVTSAIGIRPYMKGPGRPPVFRPTGVADWICGRPGASVRRESGLLPGIDGCREAYRCLHGNACGHPTGDRKKPGFRGLPSWIDGAAGPTGESRRFLWRFNLPQTRVECLLKAFWHSSRFSGRSGCPLAARSPQAVRLSFFLAGRNAPRGCSDGGGWNRATARGAALWRHGRRREALRRAAGSRPLEFPTWNARGAVLRQRHRQLRASGFHANASRFFLSHNRWEQNNRVSRLSRWNWAAGPPRGRRISSYMKRPSQVELNYRLGMQHAECARATSLHQAGNHPDGLHG